MGASLPFSSSFATSADISDSQKRSSVRLPEALSPSESAMRRSASRVRRGGDLARERAMAVHPFCGTVYFTLPRLPKRKTELNEVRTEETEKSIVDNSSLWIGHHEEKHWFGALRFLRYSSVQLRFPL